MYGCHWVEGLNTAFKYNSFYSEQQQGWTALQRLCLYNLTRYPSAKYKVSERRGEIAKILIDHGTDIRKIDSVGHCASYNNIHKF